MKIKRIHQEGLTEKHIFQLKFLYQTDPAKFVVVADQKEEILYVNRTVPQKDIEGFLEVAMFPEHWVADGETGKGRFLEYVYKKYGDAAYRVLLDSHKWHMRQREKRRAEEKAKAVLPLIEKEAVSENPVVGYDERLLSEIWRTGCRLGRKTPKNVATYGSVYLFYLGYLMGAGMLEGCPGINGKGEP